VISARGGSKSIHRKNIRRFLGKPLLAWTIDVARISNVFSQIILSTEDQEIADIGKVYGAQGSSLFCCSTVYREFRDVPSVGQVIRRIKNLPLIPGKYGVNVYLKDNWGHADMVDDAGSFSVIDGGDSGFLYFPPPKWGHVLVQHDWEWNPPADCKGGPGSLRSVG
jgi:hypothetical protein